MSQQAKKEIVYHDDDGDEEHDSDLMRYACAISQAGAKDIEIEMEW